MEEHVQIINQKLVNLVLLEFSPMVLTLKPEGCVCVCVGHGRWLWVNLEPGFEGVS